MRIIRTWLVLMFGLVAIMFVLSSGTSSAQEDSGDAPLPAPTDLTYTLSAEGLLLSWTAVDPVEIPSGKTLQRYVVEHRRNPRVLPHIAFRSEHVLETSFFDDGSYHNEEPFIFTKPSGWYSVHARYQDETGATSDSLKIWLKPAYAFGSVDSVTMSVAEDGITVSWTAPFLSWESDAISVSEYLVYRITMAEGAGYPSSYPEHHMTGSGLVARLSSPASSYLDTDATPGEIYIYAVVPRFGVFQSAITYSDDVIVVPALDPEDGADPEAE